MAYIGRQLARGENKLFDDISSSFNGSTTTFNLTVSSVATATATPYQLFVSLGGVMQKPNTDFTTAGNQITFTTAPAAGLSCWIMMQGDTIDQAAIPDASVTPSKISGSNFAFSGDLRLKDADGSHYVGFASPTTVASNKVWTLPAADGTASQYLQTNGSGVLSWATVSIGGGTGIDFNDNVRARWGTGNDLEIFHNSSNSVINDAGTGDLLLQVGGSTKATVSSTGLAVTGALTVSTNATISGNLTVSGTTTTVDSVTLSVKDKNIEMGVVSSPSDTTADGGGITLKGASDKTFNWVDSTDAWTSSEHIHLGDNKKLLVGTGSDLSIYHDASNSFILNNIGNLYIQGDSSSTTEEILIRPKQGEQSARFIANGAVELYHDNSKKVETNATGINVTGALQVNGAALASGNTLDLVADGAITAGKPVILTTAGKVTAIALETQGKTSPSIKDHTGVNGSDTGMWGAAIWHSTTSRGLLVYRRSGGSNDLRVAQFSMNSTAASISCGSSRQLYGNVTMWNKIIMDPDIDKPIVFWQTDHGGDKFVYSRSVTMNGNGSSGDGDPQGSTQGSSQPRSSQQYSDGDWDVCYDTNANIFVFVYRDDSDSGKVKTRLGYQSEPATGQHKITWINTDVTIDNDGEFPRCVFDTVNNKVIFAWGSGGGHDIGAAIGTVSGTGSSATISCGTVVTVSGDGPRKPKMAWHTDSGQAGFLYQDTSNNYNKIITLKTSGTTVHYTASTRVGTENVDDMACWYASGTKTLRTGTKGRFNWISSMGSATSGGSSSTAPTVGSGIVTLTAIGGSINDWEPNYGFDLPGHLLYTGLISTNGSDSNRMKMITMEIGEQISNAATTERLVGFASASASDGNTVTINSFGNTIDNQSSLTIGSQYYIQGDGTIGTSGDNTVGNVKAGTAISATKLLICDPRI